jgi:hypothetical protein
VSGGTDVTTQTRRAPGAPGQLRVRTPAPGGKRRPQTDRPPPGEPRLRQGSVPVRDRPGSPGRPGKTGTPGRTGRPGKTGTPGTRGTRPSVSPSLPSAGAHATTAVPLSRTPFVFLIVGLLGGGLLCLLLINTVLDTGSFQITKLQQDNTALAQRTQALQAQIAAEESPARLARRARRLGMGEPSLLHFLDLKKGKIESQPTHLPDVRVVPPGYSP